MLNYFEYYELPVQIELDLKALRKKFLAKSRALHPDFHTLSTDSDQKENLDASSINNEAYLVLSDEDKRIGHILRLHGLLDGSEKMSPEFLMEMMDVNEQLMETKMGDESALVAVKNAIQQKTNQENESLQELTKSFNISDQAKLKQLEQIFLRRKYLNRLVHQLD